MSTPEQAARTALEVSAQALFRLSQEADQYAIRQAALLISRAPMTVTCGSGSSGFAVAKFAHSLCCIERPAKFLPPAEAIHGGLGVVQASDVVVMVSRGGRTAELLPIIDVARRKGAQLVGVTENLASPLAGASDVVVPFAVARESDPLETMATTSNLIVGAIFDAILASIMVLTDYHLDQFALIHPGGAVGARLNGGSV